MSGMNWKITGTVLAVVGGAAALAGWWWAHGIHGERYRCRLANIFGPETVCPSKTPAIITAGVGAVLAVVGIALLLGAAAAQPPATRTPAEQPPTNELDPPYL